MAWHVVSLRGPTDGYRPIIGSGDEILEVPIGIAGHPQGVQSSIAQLFDTYNIAPSEESEDLLYAAIAAYAGDARIPRRRAFDRWTRDLVLHIAVREPDRWEGAIPPFTKFLRFLTGDHWTVRMRPYAPPREPHAPHVSKGRMNATNRSLDSIGHVCLFSGGLDSFTGALDYLSDFGAVVLVGHHGSGQGPTSVAQERAITSLRRNLSEDASPFLQFWVAPPRIALGSSEITTRGRSALFLTLGIAVASGIGAKTMVIPENGFISLNVPLTPSRLGSFSTRTTHPYLIATLRQVLEALTIGVELELPYRFMTKGEMLKQCREQAALADGIPETMSCAHPGAGRFSGEKVANRHCGYCLPCLIRRASIRSFMSDPTSYQVSDLNAPLTPSRGSDLRACKLALERYRRTAPRISDLLKSGPLPGTDDDRQRYLGGFSRGLAELGALVD